jgi:threonine dehydratase
VDSLSLAEVRAAHARIRDRIRRTPLLSSRILSERVGRPLHLKGEHLQTTGSFKVRGALHLLRSLEPSEAGAGVVTISAGNHAQAVAWAAAEVGVRAVVVMPADAPRAKVEASRGYGADVRLHGTVFEAFEEALRLAREEDLTFVHPFDDPRVVAGQGTVALEVLEQCPDVAAVVVPVGGGGLCAGMAVALAAAAPGVDVVGVEPYGAAAMHRSLEEGVPVRLDSVETVADGLGAPMAGDLTFPLVRDHARGIVRVRDSEIRCAMAALLTFTKQVVEPGGAAGVAAALEGRLPPGEGPVVVVLSGGNVDLDRLAELVTLDSSGGDAPASSTASGKD